MPHRLEKPDYEVPTLRRALLLILCATLMAGAGAAYVLSYRAQVLAGYIQRKAVGIQEPEEIDAHLDSVYTARLLAELPSAIGVDTTAANLARREAMARVGVAAFDRADLLDRVATALTILGGVAVAITIGTWKSRRRKPRAEYDPMIETLVRQVNPAGGTPPAGQPATRRSRLR